MSACAYSPACCTCCAAVGREAATIARSAAPATCQRPLLNIRSPSSMEPHYKLEPLAARAVAHKGRLLDDDPHLRVDPTAVGPHEERTIVDHRLQQVLARLVEGRFRRCLPLRQPRRCRIEGDGPGRRSAKLPPSDGKA